MYSYLAKLTGGYITFLPRERLCDSEHDAMMWLIEQKNEIVMNPKSEGALSDISDLVMCRDLMEKKFITYDGPWASKFYFRIEKQVRFF